MIGIAARDLDPVVRELCAGERLRVGLTLVRADETVGSVAATLLPETRVLLPLSDGRDRGFAERADERGDE